MAWVVKPSATAGFERRKEPYLTQAMRDELTRVYLPRYETKRAATLPALHMVQHAYDWIPPQAMEEIAAFLDQTPAEVIDCASFYEEFSLKPRGRTVVAVCRSIACEFCGHKEVTDMCREKLGIEVGETTEDGRVTLMELECLGSCGTAPVALIGETLHENLTPARMEKALGELMAGKEPRVESSTSDLRAVGTGH